MAKTGRRDKIGAGRKERLAAELRENLKRRKAKGKVPKGGTGSQAEHGDGKRR